MALALYIRQLLAYWGAECVASAVGAAFPVAHSCSFSIVSKQEWDLAREASTPLVGRLFDLLSLPGAAGDFLEFVQARLDRLEEVQSSRQGA